MKNILIGIILVLGIQSAYSFYKDYNNKKIILDVVNLKNCVVNSVHKKDTLMYTRDGKKIFFLKASLSCQDRGNLIVEMQYVNGRKRDKQGINMYFENGTTIKRGIWYR